MQQKARVTAFTVSELSRENQQGVRGKIIPPSIQIWVKSFVPNVSFLYPLKPSENLKVFWCFQGVEKGYIGNKWVNLTRITSLTSIFYKPYVKTILQRTFLSLIIYEKRISNQFLFQKLFKFYKKNSNIFWRIFADVLQNKCR